jgi:hypothetical protein
VRLAGAGGAAVSFSGLACDIPKNLSAAAVTRREYEQRNASLLPGLQLMAQTVFFSLPASATHCTQYCVQRYAAY